MQKKYITIERRRALKKGAKLWKKEMFPLTVQWGGRGSGRRGRVHSREKEERHREGRGVGDAYRKFAAYFERTMSVERVEQDTVGLIVEMLWLTSEPNKDTTLAVE